MTWDDESIKQLKNLWEKGLSTTEIAKKMNVSKNSVVGKVHRLCLKARPSPIKKRGNELNAETEQKDLFAEQNESEQSQITDVSENECANNKETSLTENFENSEQPRDKIQKTRISSAQKTKTDKKVKQHIKLVELDSHTCRWPIGDPRDDDFCFCGKKVHAGQTYCDEHSQIAYVKAGIKK